MYIWSWSVTYVDKLNVTQVEKTPVSANTRLLTLLFLYLHILYTGLLNSIICRNRGFIFDILCAGKSYGGIFNNNKMAKMSDTGLLFRGGDVIRLITKKVGTVSDLTVGTRKISAAPYPTPRLSFYRPDRV